MRTCNAQPHHTRQPTAAAYLVVGDTAVRHRRHAPAAEAVAKRAPPRVPSPPCRSMAESLGGSEGRSAGPAAPPEDELPAATERALQEVLEMPVFE